MYRYMYVQHVYNVHVYVHVRIYIVQYIHVHVHVHLQEVHYPASAWIKQLQTADLVYSSISTCTCVHVHCIYTCTGAYTSLK